MTTRPIVAPDHSAPSAASVDPLRCPLCGKQNACAVELGLTADACWCVAQTFPASLLERVPEPLRNVACVCRECIAAAARSESPPG